MTRPGATVSVVQRILLLRGHRVILDADLAQPKYSRTLPYACTEQGALMLGNVLKSDRPIGFTANIEGNKQ